MNPIGHIRRFAAAVAGLACALVAFAVTAPAAFAMRFPPPGGSAGPDVLPGHMVAPVYKVPVHTVTRTVVVGGMPGWQIALIAVGAALFAAAGAVLVDRGLATRRQSATATA